MKNAPLWDAPHCTALELKFLIPEALLLLSLSRHYPKISRFPSNAQTIWSQTLGALTDPSLDFAVPDILLVAINAKYIHSSIGQRSLLANAGELKSRAKLFEFDIRRRAPEIAEQILKDHPKISHLESIFGTWSWSLKSSDSLKE
jgi:hypothetical protein